MERLIFILIAICVYTASSNQTCPPNTTCLPLHACPELMSQLLMAPLNENSNSRHSNSSLLSEKRCGEPTSLKVCCFAPKPRHDSVCFTPDVKEGVCKSIRNCPHMLAILETKVPHKINYIRSSACTRADGQFNVCCGPVPELVEPPTCPLTELPVNPDTECCGKDSTNNHLNPLDGVDVMIDQFPWTALIEYESKQETEFLCVGALISSRHVIASAHCVAEQYTPKSVRLGEYDTRSAIDCLGYTIQECNENIVVIPVDLIIVHKDYTPRDIRGINNDIAILKLQRMAPYTAFIRPICLPSTDYENFLTRNSKLTTAGWRILDDMFGVHPLQKKPLLKSYANVPFIPISECQEFYARNYSRNITLWEGQMCIRETYPSLHKVELNGPLTYYNEGHHELVGLLSFGRPPCCREGTPVVYTNIRQYLPWINETLQK